MPAETPCYPDRYDNDYITTEPGLFPDVMFQVATGKITVASAARSRWIDVVLPAQKTTCTQWLNTDCISDYFKTPVFSETYREIVENYIRTAVDCGINMILTPIFIPPLDKEVGEE